MQNYDILSDKEYIEIRAGYGIGTQTESKHDKCRLLRMRPYKSSWKTIIVAKRHLQLHYRDQHSISTEMGFWIVLHPSLGQSRDFFLCLYNYVSFISLASSKVGGTALLKDLCTTLCQGNTIDHIWPIAFKRLLEIVVNESEISHLRDDDTPCNDLRQVTQLNLS